MMRLAVIGLFMCLSLVVFSQVGLSYEQLAIGNGQPTDGNQHRWFTAIPESANPSLDQIRENPPDQRHLRSNYSGLQSTIMTRQNMRYEPQHYGFFCKVESKIERKSRLAPRFRLGSVDYVDALEGKYVPTVR